MPGSLRDVLPSHYAAFLPDFFDSPAPQEPKATCEQCAMCAPAGVQPDASPFVFFHPDIKCCTFHPVLPNYLAGAVLEESNDAEGCRRMSDRIHAGDGVSAQWITPPQEYNEHFSAQRHRGFGRDARFLCPYFSREHHNCSIWAWRDAVCATFFCKYEKGEDGQAFWRALRDYLGLIEGALSRWALKQACGQRPVTDCFPGREADFFRQTWRAVRALAEGTSTSRPELPGADALKRLQDAYARLGVVSLPRRLVPNPEMKRYPAVDGSVFVISYNSYEPLQLPGEVLTALSEFTAGRSVREARQAVITNHGLSLEDDLLRRLVRFRVLVAAP